MAAKKTTTSINKKNSTAGSSTKKQPTASEMREWYAKYASRIENFERSENALQLVDPTKSSTKNFTTFSKETLRTYMKNPLRNYKNLRNLSRYLYYVSQAYRRLIQYYANMPDLRYRSVIPRVDLNKGFDQKNDMQSYYDTLMLLDELPLTTEFYKMLVIAWIEDVSFGCAYFTEKENGRYDMFILPLSADYCVVTGIYEDGSIAFDFDMTYFNSNEDLIEWWGYPWDQMWKEYQKDTRNNRYQPLPDDVAVALKVNLDSPDDILMPFMGMFSSLISLNDLVEISAIADEQEIYKLLAVTIPLLDSSSEPDDFAVDPETAINFYNKMINSLPDYTNAVILPGMDIKDISFDSNKVNDVSKVENATKTVFNSAGGGQVLHNVNISGSTGLNLAMKADELQALRPLLGEIEAIVNRLISFKLNNPSKIKFLEVTKYTSEEYKDSLIKSMNYGLPFAMTIGSLSGYSEADLIAMANVNNTLGIESLFKPLATASTRSAGESQGGAPTKSDGEITSDGEASRDKRETSND